MGTFPGLLYLQNQIYRFVFSCSFHIVGILADFMLLVLIFMSCPLWFLREITGWIWMRKNEQKIFELSSREENVIIIYICKDKLSRASSKVYEKSYLV